MARGRGRRALLFGLVTMVAGVLAHWSGSGMVASPGVLAAGFVVSVGAGWLLIPRRRAGSVVAASVGLQVVLHAAFAVCMASGMSAMSMVLCAGGHPQGVPVDVPPGFLLPQHGAMAMLFGLQGVPMLVAHLSAGLVSGTWMWAGDRLARTLTALATLGWRSVLALAPAGTIRVPRRPAGVSGDGWGRFTVAVRDVAAGGCGLRAPPAPLPC